MTGSKHKTKTPQLKLTNIKSTATQLTHKWCYKLFLNTNFTKVTQAIVCQHQSAWLCILASPLLCCVTTHVTEPFCALGLWSEKRGKIKPLAVSHRDNTWSNHLMHWDEGVRWPWLVWPSVGILKSLSVEAHISCSPWRAPWSHDPAFRKAPLLV